MTKTLLAGATALAFLASIGAASAQTKPQDQKSGAETAPKTEMQGTGSGTVTGTQLPQAKSEDQKSGGETSPKKQKEGN